MPKNNDITTAINQELERAGVSKSSYAFIGADIFNGGNYNFGLFNLLYGKKNGAFARQKERSINKFFADLFDANEIKWEIKNEKGQTNQVVKDIFLKYLKDEEFADKLWLAKFEAGQKHRYGMVMHKQQIDRLDKDGKPYTKPIIMNVDINYVNKFNNDILEISIAYSDYLWQGKKENYALTDTFSIKNNKISLLRDIWSLTKNRRTKLRAFNKDSTADVTSLQIGEREIDQHFIPVSILTTDPLELPRCSEVSETMRTLNAYDENLAILPFWERGGIMRNTSEPNTPTSEYAHAEFMRDLLLQGSIVTHPNMSDQIATNLAQETVTWQPMSIMQTMRKTRNDIYNEIKQDLGIPYIDTESSAQKNTAYIYAEQFLTSPTIEREKSCYIKFLRDFGRKFLMFLNENYLPESNQISMYDFSKWSITADLNLTTEKNIARTVKFMQDNGSNIIANENKQDKELETNE